VCSFLCTIDRLRKELPVTSSAFKSSSVTPFTKPKTKLVFIKERRVLSIDKPMTSEREYTTDITNKTVTLISKQSRPDGGLRIDTKVHNVDHIFSAGDTDETMFDTVAKPFLEGMLSGTITSETAAIVLTGQSGIHTSSLIV
jgi:hypothetical protein